MHIYLVGGFNPSEKYEFVSWDYYSQYMESHKKPWFQTKKPDIYIYIYTYAIICIHDFSASFMDLRSALSPLIGSTTHTRFDPTRFGPSNVAKSPAQRAAQRAVSACHGHGSVLGSWANVP